VVTCFVPNISITTGAALVGGSPPADGDAASGAHAANDMMSEIWAP
jgi:hypothetical protein